MRLEVRCCCQPTKLLGWLEIGNYLPHHPLPRFIRFPALSSMRRSALSFPYIELPIEMFHTAMDEEPMREYPAIKAEGVTLDQLKTLHGFTEAT